MDEATFAAFKALAVDAAPVEVLSNGSIPNEHATATYAIVDVNV